MRNKQIAIYVKLLLTFFLMMSVAVYASEKKLPLPAEQAFALSVTINNPQQVKVKWQIEPGYYLYRQKIHFIFTPAINANIHYPQAEIKTDQERGSYEVYTGNLIIPISLANTQHTVEMQIDYQGCSSGGFCYPPMQKSMRLDLQKNTLTDLSHSSASLHALLTDQNGVLTLLSSQHLAVQWLVFAFLGLLLAFTPCVLPMIPILTGIIVDQENMTNTRKAFLLSASYVLGMALTYALAGVLAASLGSSIQVWLQKPIFIYFAAILFVLLALSLLGLYDIHMPRRWHNKVVHWSNRHEGGTHVGVFFMGALSTLIVSPCVTAPLIGVLIFIGQTGNVMLGASALFAMGIGMGIPLLVIGTSAGKWLPRSGHWMEAIKKIFGILLLAMAIWLLSRIVASITTSALLALLCVGVAYFFAFYLSRVIGWRKCNYSLALLSVIMALSLMANGLHTFALNNSTKSASSFIIVHNVTELNKQLLLAQAAHRPVLLDFYADWCESCVVMDRKVFSLTDVRQRLRQFILLRADLSANTADDETLLKNFNVIAPPTVLLFNRDGYEINSHRIIGEVDRQEFLMRLNTFFTADCDKKTTC